MTTLRHDQRATTGLSGRGAPLRRRRARRGMNLIEIMIVVAIMVALIALAVPLGSSLLRLEQKQAASKLASVYERLHDEAMLRNLTFRIAYHLEDRYYEVEASETGALLFSDPQKRLEHEAAVQEKMERKPRRPDPDAVQAVEVDEEGISLEASDFAAVQDKFLKRFDLPSGTDFGGVYTPAYGEMIAPSDEPPEELEDHEKHVVYSYILPSGMTEHTVVQLRRTGTDTGFTVEIEPMTGHVHLSASLTDWNDRFDFVPQEGPDLQQ